MKNKKIKLCIITTSKDAYSETFISAHYKMLSGETFFLYQTNSSFVDINDNVLYRPSVFDFKKIFYYIFKKQNLSYNYYKLKFLKKYFKNNKIDIVLAEYGMTGEFVTNLCFDMKIPLIVHFHGFDAHKISVIENNNYYKNVFKKASAIIVVSKFMEQQLISIGANKDKLFYNPCGPNTKFKTVTAKLNSNYFLSVGRFVDKKSPFLTILAFKNVLNEYPDVKLKMCGDGPLLEACKILIKGLKIEHSVEFLGVQSHSVIVKLMSEARAFVQHSVQPSHGDAEGTPVAVLEASLTGIPVIATKHAGISDVIINGKTGFLINEYDIEDMAKYMKLVLTDIDKAKQIGAAARDWIEKNFSLTISINRLDEIITKIYNDSIQ